MERRHDGLAIGGGEYQEGMQVFLPLGAFQGDLSPLSTRSIIETCAMPILLFGSENWIVSGDILDQLESFLGELAKRALKWPRHFSNTAAMTVLDLDSVTSRIVVWKRRFLKRHLAVGVCRGYQYS